jgi:hypothetical protein
MDRFVEHKINYKISYKELAEKLGLNEESILTVDPSNGCESVLRITAVPKS